MPISYPDPGPEPGPRRPRERDHAHAHAREEEPRPATGGAELLEFPGGAPIQGGGPGQELQPRPEPQLPAEQDPPGGWFADVRVRAGSNVWVREASETARRAVDGSVWSARPPALRDSHERLQRAEWANGIPALRIAGQIYGYAALSVRAVLLAACWLLEHPTRLVVAAAITVAAFAVYLT